MRSLAASSPLLQGHSPSRPGGTMAMSIFPTLRRAPSPSNVDPGHLAFLRVLSHRSSVS